MNTTLKGVFASGTPSHGSEDSRSVRPVSASKIGNVSNKNLLRRREFPTGSREFLKKSITFGLIEAAYRIGHYRDAPSRFQQSEGCVLYANLGDHTVDHTSLRNQDIQQCRQIRIGEAIDRLFLKQNLARVLNIEILKAAGNSRALFEQRCSGFLLPGGSGDAMRGPRAKLGIVFGVRVHGGDDRNAMTRGVLVERGDSGDDRLRSGNVERAGWIQKIQLRVHIEKDIEKNHAHARAPLLTLSCRAASSGLMSTRQPGSLANRLMQVAGKRASDSEA